MKNLIILTLLLFVSKIGYTQINVPQESLDYFQKEFNSHEESNNIEWSTNELGYVVNYEYNDKKRVAQFDESGNFKENRIYINMSRLNIKVQDYISTNFGDAVLIQSFEVTSNTAPERNEVIIEIEGETSTLFFRPNGDFHYQK